MDRALPDTGTLDEYMEFLSYLRSARDSIDERMSTISHEFHNIQGLADIHQLRLINATNVLRTVETLIGEARARYRARGIPLYPLPERCRKAGPNTDAARTSSEAITVPGPCSVAGEVPVSPSKRTFLTVSQTPNS